MKTVSKRNHTKFWKTLVGLPHKFPELYPLSHAEITDLMVIDPDQLNRINQGLVTNQFTQVFVRPGWGLTTLFQYMVRTSLTSALERLIVPVQIDLGKSSFSDDISSTKLEEEIKMQIISILIELPWEGRLNRDYYFHSINYTDSVDLDAYRAQMRKFLFDKKPAPRSVYAQFPWLKSSLEDLLNYLLTNFRIQTAILYHFPRDVAEQRVLDLVRSLKAIYENNKFEFAAIREVYFCTPIQGRDLDREFKRPFHSIDYPIYNPAQVYTMLVKRYFPYVPGSQGRNMVALSSIFSEEFIRRSWSEQNTLTGIMMDVQRQMEMRLTCLENEVPFRLEPSDIAAHKEEELTSVESGPGNGPETFTKRRFTRKGTANAGN